MQIRNNPPESNGQKEIFEVIEYAINQGLSNDKLDFFTKPKDITFKEYIGAKESEGYFRPNDIVPAGLFLYGRENFINTPSTIFKTDDSDVAFYDLEWRAKRYIVLECLSRKELTDTLVALKEEQVVVDIYSSLPESGLFSIRIYGYIPNSFAESALIEPEFKMNMTELENLWIENYK